MNVTIRDCRLPDDLHDLTELLHRAYAELAARGLKYVASYQTPDVTEERVRSGRCFVAEAQGRLVGTITVRPTKPDASVPLQECTGSGLEKLVLLGGRSQKVIFQDLTLRPFVFQDLTLRPFVTVIS